MGCSNLILFMEVLCESVAYHIWHFSSKIFIDSRRSSAQNGNQGKRSEPEPESYPTLGLNLSLGSPGLRLCLVFVHDFCHLVVYLILIIYCLYILIELVISSV